MACCNACNLACVCDLGRAASAAFMTITPHAQAVVIPSNSVTVARIKTKTIPDGGTINRTKLSLSAHTVSNTWQRDYAYLAKKVAVPMEANDGVIKTSSVATHAATEQRNNACKSRALKWSSHAGSFDVNLAIRMCPCPGKSR